MPGHFGTASPMSEDPRAGVQLQVQGQPGERPRLLGENPTGDTWPGPASSQPQLVRLQNDGGQPEPYGARARGDFRQGSYIPPAGGNGGEPARLGGQRRLATPRSGLGLPRIRPAEPDPYSRLETIPPMDEPAKLGQPSLLGRYETLLGQEPTHEQFPVKKMGKLRTGLGLAMAALAGPNSAGPLADMVLHGREREAEKRFEQAHQEWEGRLGRVEKEARLGEVSARTREAEARARQLEAKPDSPSDKKIDEYVNDQGQRTLIFQRPNGETYEKAFGKTQPKPAGHTNPFEAFAYGDANERKAAQDFIAFEKRMGSQYQRPGEVEQRYQLYKLDPDAYKQMFGKEGGDRAHASRMLTYFQRQRDSVSKDFMLDEATKAQRLREIEELERPFLETAGVGAGQNGQKFKPGQTVYDKQGNPRKIKRVLPGGKLELE